MARILLAEDDDNLRPFLARSLENAGHEVLAFSDGEDALPVLNIGEVDILISDLVMPGSMSGYQLVDTIRQRRPDLPVLLTSGYAEDRIAPERLEAHALPLLRKPYTLADLAYALVGLLARED